VTDEEVLVVGVAGEMNFDFIEDSGLRGENLSAGAVVTSFASLPVPEALVGWEGWEVRLSVCPVSCGSRLPPVFLPVYRYR
jgi:hypothetical protein